MTDRSTYEASVKAAATPRVVSNIANAAAHQETIIAIGTMANGVSAANDRTIRAANATYVAAKQKACLAEQIAVQAAKDTLRSAGDTGPA